MMAVGMSMLVAAVEFVFLADAVMVHSDAAERDSLQDVDDLIESADNIFFATNIDDGNDIDEEKIKLVQLKATCSRAQAVNALLSHGIDANEAVQFLRGDDDVLSSCSSESSTGPMIRPLPSGKIMDFSKKPSSEYDAFTTVLSSVAFNEESSQVGDGPSSSANSILLKYKEELPGMKFRVENDLGEIMNDLFTACRSGDTGIVKRILSEPDVDINKLVGDNVNPSGPTRRHDFVQNRQAQQAYKEVIHKYQIRYGADDNLLSTGITPLLLATHHGHCSIVQLLLNHPDIDVNKGNGWRITPLILAIDKNQLELVKIFLGQKQIDMNLEFCRGEHHTALSFACKKINLEIVHILQNHLVHLGKPVNDVQAAMAKGYKIGLDKYAEKNETEKVNVLRQELTRLGIPQQDIAATATKGYMSALEKTAMNIYCKEKDAFSAEQQKVNVLRENIISLGTLSEDVDKVIIEKYKWSLIWVAKDAAQQKVNMLRDNLISLGAPPEEIQAVITDGYRDALFNAAESFELENVNIRANLMSLETSAQDVEATMTKGYMRALGFATTCVHEDVDTEKVNMICEKLTSLGNPLKEINAEIRQGYMSAVYYAARDRKTEKVNLLRDLLTSLGTKPKEINSKIREGCMNALHFSARDCETEKVNLLRDDLLSVGTPPAEINARIRKGCIDALRFPFVGGETEKMNKLRENLISLGTPLEQIHDEIKECYMYRLKEAARNNDAEEVNILTDKLISLGTPQKAIKAEIAAGRKEARADQKGKCTLQ